MMDLSSPALKQIEVTLTDGHWHAKPYWDWHGLAKAEEPIVAVILLKCEGEVAWCKSERPGDRADSGALRLPGLGHAGHIPGAPIRLALFWYDKIGKDVQVNFSVGGGGRRCQMLLPWPGYHPQTEPGPYITGRSSLFARIDGIPHIECHVLFLAAQQVCFGRKGLWRVREQVAEALQPQLRSILTRARTGIFQDVG